MENEFIKLHIEAQPEIIEVKTEMKQIPKRITIVYELATTNKNICEEIKEDESENLSR